MPSLLIRLHSLGDVVLAEPAARFLAGSAPVLFAVRERYAPLVERMGEGVRPLPLPAGGGVCDLRRLVRTTSPDRIVDLQGNLTSRLAVWPRRARTWTLDRKLRKRILGGGDLQMPYRATEFLRTAGGGGSAMPHLERRSPGCGGFGRAGLVAGGRWLGKSIPPGVLAEVARRLVDLAGMEVLVLGAPEDRDAASEVAGRALRKGVTPVAGEGGLERLMERIESLDVLVSPDSGPAHLASALGVPAVVVFTSTHPRLGFWPHDMQGAVFSGDLACRPCHRHGGHSCPRGDWQCRRGLLPADIVDAALSVMDSGAEDAFEDGEPG